MIFRIGFLKLRNYKGRFNFSIKELTNYNSRTCLSLHSKVKLRIILTSVVRFWTGSKRFQNSPKSFFTKRRRISILISKLLVLEERSKRIN